MLTRIAVHKNVTRTLAQFQLRSLSVSSQILNTEPVKKDWRNLPEFSIEKFLEDNPNGLSMNEDQLQTSIEKAAKQSLINFRNKEEEEQFRTDFKSALVFTKKLDEVDVTGVDSLDNVLDIYGGNSQKMMLIDDFFTSDSLTDLDQQININDIDF